MHQLKRTSSILAMLAAAIVPASATAVVGSHPHGLAFVASSLEDEALVVAEQATFELPQVNHGFQLMAASASPLLGSYGLGAKEVLAQIAPHLAAAEPQLVRATSSSTGKSVHEVYTLTFGGYAIARTELTLHHFKNKLALLRAAVPDAMLPDEAPQASDFLPLSELGYPDARKPQKVLAVSSGFLSPAWQFVHDTSDGSGPRELIVDAQTGATLDDMPLHFDMANVYAKNPLDGALTGVDLPDLPGTGYLDGKYFAVYAPTNAEPRATAPDLIFDFRPDDPAESLFFDQVQAYYAASRALGYFRDELGFVQDGPSMPVRINMLVDGRADNAMYLRPPLGPEILVGMGNEVLHNLARDVDVIAHEYAHHIIYQTVKIPNGESGIIHEGTADYFAYAMAGDPYLGESIVPGGLYLRTAMQPEGERFDSWPASRGTHARGQLWSAVLWELRSQLGPAADKLVYESLAYLGASSGLRDAFLGLINADRDLFPLDGAASDAALFGSNKCLILNVGVKWGFAAYLDRIDGSSCGLDLITLGEESRALMDGKAVPKSGRKGPSVSIFGRTCSVVGASNGASSEMGTTWSALALLLLPVVVLSGRRRCKRGS